MELKAATIQQKELIPAKPEEVYHALVDPKQHAEFTGAQASGEAQIGGTFTAWDNYISGS